MKHLLISLISIFLLTACSSPQDIIVPESPKTEQTILALGDSITAGYGLPETDSYPAQLEVKLQSLGYNYRVQNAGISGDTSAGLLSRMDWLLEGASPSLAILCIGGNDAFQGKSVEDIEKNIRTIIDQLQSKKIPILFVGMEAPLNLGGEYGKKYESIFPKLADEYDLPFMPFLLSGVALKGTLNQDDRIHPNREGYAVVVENLVEILEDEDLVTK